MNFRILILLAAAALAALGALTLLTGAARAGVGTGPNVLSVDVPAPGTYHVGDHLDFVVHWDEPIRVHGLSAHGPALYLRMDSGDRNANYLSGDGTADLAFRYTVQAGDASDGGTGLQHYLGQIGSWIEDLDGIGYGYPYFPSVGDDSGVLIDGTPPPLLPQSHVTSFDFSSSASGTLRSGDSAEIAVHFDQPVFVTGDPMIFLGVGCASVWCDGSHAFADLSHYASGSGTDTLVFRWQPKADLHGPVSIRGIIDNLDGVANAIKNADGVNTEMHLVSNGNYYTPTGFSVDTPARVSSVDVPAAGTYTAGDNLDVVVHFSSPVTVSGGPPRVNLFFADGFRKADYLSGSGTADIRFRYTVVDGDLDVDGITLGTVVFMNAGTAGGMITDGHGFVPDLNLKNVPATNGVLVDAVAPTVTSVEVPAAGFYGVGDQLDLVMHFDENLVINLGGSIPVIFINVGGQPQEASYVSGHGSELTFRYTVQAGDTSDDGLRITGWLMRGAYFYDAAGNEIDGTLNNIGDGSHVFVGIDAPLVPTTPTPAPAPAPAPEAKDTTPPTKPATATAKVKGGQVQVSVTGSTDNVKVVGYRLYRDATAIATVEGTDFKLPVTLNEPGRLVLHLRALDSAGNLSEAVVLTLTRKAHPKAPKVKPAWAWKLARWQDTPSSKRGARPHTPTKLPTWYAKWNAWHKAPVKVTVG